MGRPCPYNSPMANPLNPKPPNPLPMPDAERLESRPIFRGRIVELSVDRVRLPNGEVAELEMIHHQGGAAVVPLLSDGRVLLLRQFRYPTGGWLWELPAGKLEAGEDPAHCARRELEEETGWRLATAADGGPGELESLGWIWSAPGYADEKIWLFLARGLVEANEPDPEDHEVFQLETLPLSEAVDMAFRGEIHDAKTVCALLRAWSRLEG